MKNLFDYATKELSQDAFLRWFIESANEGEIQKEAKEFICFLLNTKPSKKEFAIDKRYTPESISDIRSWAQVSAKGQKIDIVVDYKFNGIDEIFIIEDKTVSSEHDDQLKTYRDEVIKWDNDRTAHFIYYKTDFLNDREKEVCLNLGFKIFDIQSIHEYFSKIKDSKSQILNDYVSHIEKLYKERTEVSSNPNTKEWSFENWKLYLQKNIEPRYPMLSVDHDIYQGKYFSAMFYFANWRDYNQSVCLEILFRKEHVISALIHPYNCKRTSDTWKREYAKEVCDLAETKLPSRFFKHFRKAQTIATSKENIEMNDINEVEKNILMLIEDFKESFKNVFIK